MSNGRIRTSKRVEAFSGYPDPLTYNVAAKLMAANAQYLLPRNAGGGTLDSPRRDVDEECGFPRRGEIGLENYYNLFEREPVAARVVEIMPKECWKVPPQLVEDEDPDVSTPLEEAWDQLGKGLRGTSWYRPSSKEEGSPIWAKLQQVDELSGIGSYGVLLLGLEGDQDLSKPANGIGEGGTSKGKVNNKLVYLRAYSHKRASIKTWELDKNNPRYGHPLEYSINTTGVENLQGAGPPIDTSLTVHWSRVVHVADIYHQASDSEVLAVPRMRPVYNNLLNVRKVSGASGEFYWNHGSRDLIISTHPQLGGKVRFASDMRTEVEKFQTGLQRSLRLTGMDAKTLNPAVSDPTAHLDAQINLICIKLVVPKRIFLGSERGELSSSQDARFWAECVMGRETGYITPGIIVPFVDRCIILGVLPEPKDSYTILWKDLRELGPTERAGVVSQRVEAMAKYQQGRVNYLMSERDFLTRELDYSQEDAEAIMENALEAMEGREPEMPEESQGMQQPQQPAQEPQGKKPVSEA